MIDTFQFGNNRKGYKKRSLTCWNYCIVYQKNGQNVFLMG